MDTEWERDPKTDAHGVIFIICCYGVCLFVNLLFPFNVL